MSRVVPKTPERLAVEECIKTSPGGITPREIGIETGIGMNRVHQCVSAIIKARQAYNENDGHRGAAVLVWGPPKVGRITTRFVPTGHYAGEKPAARRPGALDFLDLPSLVHGECIERRRPILIGASA